jgi:hypothetical protein
MLSEGIVRASVEAMNWFVRYWTGRDTSEILRSLEMFTPEEQGDEAVLPESPERRRQPVHCGVVRGEVRQMGLEMFDIVLMGRVVSRRGRGSMESSESEFEMMDSEMTSDGQ